MPNALSKASLSAVALSPPFEQVFVLLLLGEAENSFRKVLFRFSKPRNFPFRHENLATAFKWTPMSNLTSDLESVTLITYVPPAIFSVSASTACLKQTPTVKCSHRPACPLRARWEKSCLRSSKSVGRGQILEGPRAGFFPANLRYLGLDFSMII